MRRRAHISGPTLCGFWGMFEEDYGTPTGDILPIITPSFVGSSLLPFRCPGCKTVAQELVCPKTREYFHDRRMGRDNYWCPNCGLRFRLNLQGSPLSCDLKSGAMVGPSRVNDNGVVTWQDTPSIVGAILGAVAEVVFGRGGRYDILAGI